MKIIKDKTINYTFTRGKKRSYLDLIITNLKAEVKVLTNVRQSDHNPILAKVKSKSKREQKERKEKDTEEEKENWITNLKGIKECDWDLYAKSLEEAIAKEIWEKLEIEEREVKIIETIGLAAELAGLKKRKKKRRKGKSKKYYWDEELKAQQKVIDSLFKELMTNREMEVQQIKSINEELKLKNKEMKKLIRKKKRKFWKDFQERWEKEMKDNPRNFWSIVDNKRKVKTKGPNLVEDEEGKMTENEEQAKEVWRRHFDRTFNPKDLGEDKIKERINLEWETAKSKMKEHPSVLNKKITVEELNAAIKKMKNGKSGGKDGMVNEFIKYAKEEFKRKLVDHFNQVLDSGVTPKYWNIGIVFPIFKGGNEKVVANYRPITILPVIGKVFDAIINRRLVNHTKEKISPNQAGFRNSHRCADQILIMKEVLLKQKHLKKDLFAVYIDVKAAYDSVNRNLLYTKLVNEFNITGKVLSVIMNGHKNHRIQILTPQGVTEEIEVTSGVPQGGISSPILYSCFSNSLLTRLSASGLGIYVNEDFCGALAYADDVVLLAESPTQLNQMLKIVEDYANESLFKINVNKTKIQVFGAKKEKKNHNFYMYGQKIEEVDFFKYLGMDIEDKRKQNVFVKRTLEKSRKSFNELIRNGTISFNCSVKHNIRMADALVFPILLYGQEAIELSKTNEEKIERFIRSVQRFAMGLTKSTPNIAIQGELDTLTFRELCYKLKLRYYFNLKYDHPRLVTRICKSIMNFFEDKGITNSECFYHRMENTMKVLDLKEEELAKMNKEKRKRMIGNKIKQSSVKIWKERIKKSKILKNYSRYKKAPKREAFLGKIGKSVRLKIKIRIGVLNL